MVIVNAGLQRWHGVSVFVFPFRVLDLEGAVAGFIEACVLMENVVRPPEAFCGFHIRLVGHPHHKAVGMRMGWVDIASNPAVKSLWDVLYVVIPVGGHGQRISDEKPPQGVLEPPPNFSFHVIFSRVLFS